MILNEDPRVQTSVLYALVTHDLPDEITSEWLYEYGSSVAGSDILCHEVALHAAGGFSNFIDIRATDELLARAGRVREWPGQPLGVYEYLDVERDVLTVRELATGDRRDVLHLGAVTGLDRDAQVFGRLVPVATPPGAMFEHRPIEVDPQTARRLLDEPGDPSKPEFLAIFADAAEAGRMPWRPGTRVGTLLWSDALIVDERFEELIGSELEPAEPAEPTEWVRDLLADGVPTDVVLALATCQLALDTAERLPEALPVTATHAATNLSAPIILRASREHLTGSENAEAWRILAGYVQEPLRSQCHKLAAVAAAKSRS